MPPKKNNQNKPNGFLLFAQEIKNELLREGYSIRTTNDLVNAASSRWQNLPKDEKEYYKEKAKYDWENRHVTGKYQKPQRNDRRDCNGALISDRVDVAQLTENRRRCEREEVFLSFQKGRDVLDQKFFFVSFICLLEEPQYQPVEVAAVQFSLMNGIERTWHKFIDPGPIPVGYRYKAQQTSESTHKVPCEGLTELCDSYTHIFDGLVHFLTRGREQLPPIHVKKYECDRVEGCMKWLAQNAGRHNNLRRIYEVEGLILDLESHLDGEPLNFSKSIQDATVLLSSTIFDWDSGTGCKWHEENDSMYCALANVKKNCYCISSYFCKNFDIQITENHLPPRNNEECYTAMTSHSSNKNQTWNVKQPAVQSYKTTSTEIVERVQKFKIAENLRLEDEQTNLAAEEERFRKEMEHKKRWQTLRGGSATIPDTSSAATNTSTVHSPPKISQVTPGLGRARGRGRGAMTANLRRPGEIPRHVPTNATTNNLIPTGSTRLGRGLSVLDQFTTEVNGNDKRWAGTVLAPHASQAPTPPHAWIT